VVEIYEVLICCFVASVVSQDCIQCPLNSTVDKRPVGSTFLHYLPWFLKDNPGVTCPKGLVDFVHFHIKVRSVLFNSTWFD